MSPEAWLQSSLPVADGGLKVSLRQDLPVPEEAGRGIQKQWERPMVEMSINTLTLRASNMQEIARLSAIRQPSAGDWLNALPSPQLGNLLDNESFRVICALPLGGSVCQPHR